MQGLGTKASPFKVYTKEDFMRIVENPDAFYIQCKNINIKGLCISVEFSGCYDGDNYVLISEKLDVPLFSSLRFAAVRNLSLLCKENGSDCVFSRSIKKSYISQVYIELLDRNGNAKDILAREADGTSISGVRVYGSCTEDHIIRSAYNYCYADTIIAENNCKIFGEKRTLIAVGCRSDLGEI